MTATAVPQTPPNAADASRRRRFDGNDERASISIYPSKATASTLLTARGWTRGGRGEWIAPDGAWVWDISEALTHALEAEADAIENAR